MTTAIATTPCSGPGSKLVRNERTATRIPCPTCAKYHAPLPAAQRLDATMAALAHQTTDPQVQEIEAELAKPGNERLFALMNGKGEFAVFSSPASPAGEPGDPPAPGATLSPVKRHLLEQELDLQRRLAQDPQSSPAQRKRAAMDVAKLEKLLAALPTTAQ
jgi:hypothetical protein